MFVGPYSIHWRYRLKFNGLDWEILSRGTFGPWDRHDDRTFATSEAAIKAINRDQHIYEWGNLLEHKP